MTVDWLHRRLRAAPSIELVPYDRLTTAQRASLGDLVDDDRHFGAAVRSGRPVHGLDVDTALLLYALRTPGALPGFARRAAGSQATNVVTRLVLDGLLEIEVEGEFRSGASALELLSRPAEGGGRLGALTRAVLEAVVRLRLDDPLVVASRLYFGGRLAWAGRWRQRWPDREAVSRELGLSETAQVGSWSVAKGSAPDWWHLVRGQEAAPSRNGVFKLYVSPAPDHAAAALAAVVHEPALARATHLKIGRDAIGLLRPDKLVAYFATRDALAESGDALSRALRGIPAHGVPFTSAITDDGLLSWGFDPPVARRAAGWPDGWSWRLVLAHRIGAILARANTLEATAAIALVRAKLSAEGVDVARWAPGET